MIVFCVLDLISYQTMVAVLKPRASGLPKQNVSSFDFMKLPCNSFLKLKLSDKQ